MALCIISESQAKESAIRFFEQYNSPVEAKNSVLKGNFWTVTVVIGGIKPATRTVTINANDRRIVGYE